MRWSFNLRQPFHHFFLLQGSLLNYNCTTCFLQLSEVDQIAYLQLDEEQIKSYTLAEIEMLLQFHGKNLMERYPSMPRTDVSINSDGRNRLIYDELRYNKYSLKEEHDRLMSTMTTEQKSIYDTTGLRPINKVFFFV
ncbi:hypothetical protein MtrunA17_Chr4g0022121 [Medicago truncatula]|uniref:Uncharacterized protein n=1 Tax=Medicago truncatula TaxID=3880 RepID=A0A396I5V5_MEDTR|nr:hypothetical protein MtrunA17_Chr4g0022121 [Medicago truncatula]